MESDIEDSIILESNDQLKRKVEDKEARKVLAEQFEKPFMETNLEECEETIILKNEP